MSELAPVPGHALESLKDALAEDVGRLRRRLDPDSSARCVADRLAGLVASLHWILTPSASELSAIFAPGDPEAIAEAIEIVDQEWERLLARMGGRP